MKTYLKQLIFTFLLLIGWLWVFASPQEELDYTSTPLLPEVEALLKIPEVTEEMLEDNIYPALIGIHAPADMDFIEVGKKIVLDTTSTIKIAYETQDMSLLEDLHSRDFNEYYLGGIPLSAIRKIKGIEDYYVSCPFRLDDPLCMEKIVAARATNEAYINANKILLERYNTIQQLPKFDRPLNVTAHFLDGLIGFMIFSDLRLIHAVYLVEDGLVDEAFLILREEKIFWEKIALSEKSILIIDALDISNRLKLIDYYFSELADKGQFKKLLNTPEVTDFIKPYPKSIEHIVANGYLNELKTMIIMFFYNKWTDPLKPRDINASLNIDYELLTRYIRHTALRTIPESSKFYRDEIATDKMKKWTEHLREDVFLKYKDKNYLNLYNNSILTDILRQTKQFQYDLVIVHALVGVKLKIKQADIKVSVVNDFLITLGAEAINPYTLKPFIWNQETKKLSTTVFDHRFQKENQLFYLNIQFN